MSEYAGESMATAKTDEDADDDHKYGFKMIEIFLSFVQPPLKNKPISLSIGESFPFLPTATIWKETEKGYLRAREKSPTSAPLFLSPLAQREAHRGRDGWIRRPR